VKAEGKIIVIGFASGTIPQIPANLLLVKNIEVIGFNFGLYLGWGLTDERATYAARLAEMMQTVFAHMVAGELKPLASQTYPLENFVEAFDSIVSRKSTGRVLLQIAA
jgi:NADPH:quinone reductase